MPRRRTHFIASISIPTIIALFNRLTNEFVFQFGIATLLCVIGGLAPDLIEPAKIYPYYTHRAFFHSWKLFGIISIITASFSLVWYYTNSDYILYLISFLVGYILHLLLDSFTKMSLPVK